jgi:multidrug efflux pump subunit AcrB
VFSRFFIDRPIFASVLSIVITLAGAVAVGTLPIAQYPQITPPTIQVMCNYPGASAKVVADTVAAPIEQQVNGVEDMLYMSSTCTNDGNYNLAVTFKPGVNLNFAQVLVQNRVNLALPNLPDVVKATGITTRKRSPDILLVISLVSPNGQYDQLYLSNYCNIYIKDEIARIDGVGDTILFGGQDYAMRVWVDPEKLASCGLSALDVVNAVREQNTQVTAGQVGQPPTSAGQQQQITLTVLGRLRDPGQFDNIVLKTGAGGRIVRVRDVGHAELGGKNWDITAKIDGNPCANLAVFQLPDANALATADRVRDKMEDLKKSFREGVEYVINYDTTPFIRESMREVWATLIDAVILVALVVLLFLQNWRSAVIPLIAVPVAIVGTFAVMAAIGFSLNNLTLFGLVLAIGIVVDDAIVVVEAVEHYIEQGMAPRDATVRAMSEVSGPIVAMALVLSAVFLPCAFISGITGQFFRQFALTIAVSTVISAFNSLTLSPALSALMLRRPEKGRLRPFPLLLFALVGAWLGFDLPRVLHGLAEANPSLAAWLPHPAELPPRPWDFAEPWYDPGAWWPALARAAGGLVLGWLAGTPINFVLGWFFGLFNAGFRRATNLYTRLVGLSLRGSGAVLVLYGGLLLLTWWGLIRLPFGYIPAQDKGYLLLSIQLPDASSLERTREVTDRVNDICAAEPGVGHTIAIAGQSFVVGAFGSNFGQMFLPLKSFDERREIEEETGIPMDSDAIAARLRKEMDAKVPDATVVIFGPPPVSGLGTGGGYKFLVEDRADLGVETMGEEADKLIGKTNPAPPDAAKADDRTEAQRNAQERLKRVFTIFRANTVQLFADVNREQCTRLGVSLDDVNNTLQVYLGSYYVNDFNLFGRTWQVVVQAEGKYRDQVDDVRRLQVRSRRGKMVPLGTLAQVKEVNGPLLLTRYNMYPAVIVNGDTSAGVSSGQAVDTVEKLAQDELPPGMAIEWTEITYMQIRSGNTAFVIFGLAVLLVFLVLAAQYESWSLPLAVILAVPMCILGTLTGVTLTHSDVNIFTQIGFVVLVGLASKNAILIVEFAKHKRESGLPRREATLEACTLRLRPILMTSFAFIFGVVPLLVSTGAAAEMRRTLGTAVFSGMLGVTLFGIFLTPVFFYLINRLTESRQTGPSVALSLVRAFGAALLFLFALAVSWLVLGQSAAFRGLAVHLAGSFALAVVLVGVPWGLGLAVRRRRNGNGTAVGQ